MAKKKKRASFNPDDLSTSTGLLDDADVRFTESRFEMFDYGGKAPEAPAFISKLVDVDDESSAHEQVWTVGGSPQDWEIGDDGDILIPLTRKAEKGINVNSNFGQLLVSLSNAGFPKKMLDESEASVFDDMVAHVIRVEGKSSVRDDNGEKKTKEVLVVDSITTLPGGEEAKGAKGKDDDDDDAPDAAQDATDFINGILEEDDEVTKKDLPKKAFTALKDKTNLNDIMALLFSDEFLKAGPWKFKGGVISKK